MSSTFIKNVAPQWLFRSVNGSKITLYDKSSLSTDARSKNIIKFVLRKEKSLHISTSLLFILITLFLWKAFDYLLPFIISIITLTLQFISFLTSAYKDTLIVVESIGVYIEVKKLFCVLNSCEFLPWDTVADVFINEVINGQKVLYYLTIIVKESVDGKESVRLVPLFQELIPE